jgi:regulator of protease activity HflC (stomatin/prohibitin superfamily)
MLLFSLMLCVVVILAILVFNGFFSVNQQTNAIVERFGKFKCIALPGLNWKIPLIDSVAGCVTLRLIQMDVEIETKTKDDVFAKIVVSVQYRALQDKIFQAFYTLDNPEQQIQAFVFDVVRARVPNINLDDVFSKKDNIANSVKEELKEIMNEFGYDILNALVTDIHPDSKVKAAMNEINESQRLRIAANERGEAEKILKIKQAEAEAESKILQGKGVAGQRQEIVNGLKESISAFQHDISGTETHAVMTLILMTQYFDTLRDMSSHGKMNSILLPHSPAGLHDLYGQIRDNIISANQVDKKS